MAQFVIWDFTFPIIWILLYISDFLSWILYFMDPFYFRVNCLIWLKPNLEDQVRKSCREEKYSETPHIWRCFILCSHWIKSLGRCKILGWKPFPLGMVKILLLCFSLLIVAIKKSDVFLVPVTLSMTCSPLWNAFWVFICYWNIPVVFLGVYLFIYWFFFFINLFN